MPSMRNERSSSLHNSASQRFVLRGEEMGSQCDPVGGVGEGVLPLGLPWWL